VESEILLGGWATQHKSILPHKNNNLSAIVAVGGGNILIFQCFWTNEEKISLVGTICIHWGWETLQTDRRKFNNIPSMSSLSSCNTAEFYLQIVDCKVRPHYVLSYLFWSIIESIFNDDWKNYMEGSSVELWALQL